MRHEHFANLAFAVYLLYSISDLFYDNNNNDDNDDDISHNRNTMEIGPFEIASPGKWF